MRISKKIFAIALSVLMAVSMMPFTAFADALPTATVTEIEAPEGLDVAYKYVANNDGSANYDSYLADFVISFDKDIEAGDVKLGGAYDAYDNGNWQIFDCPALAAGQEYKLLEEGVSALLGREVSMTYEEIRDIVQEFRCGVAGVDAAGATMTVKLNLYDPATGAATEIVSGTKEYTFEEDELPTATVTEIAAPEGLDVAYKYTPNENGSAKYRDYLADFTISFDKAIEEGDVKLGGAYDAYDNGNWQIFDCPALAAGQEYKLLEEGVSAILGREVSMTYGEVLDIVQEFRCGVAGVDAAGATMTVKLNLYDPATGEAIEIESAHQEYEFPAEEDVLPTATVTEIEAPEGLDVAYKYTPNEDGSAKYRDYLADFTISFNQDVNEGDVKLGGAYDAYNNGEWQIFDCPALAAGQEYKLLEEGVSALLGREVSMTYGEVLDIVQEFRCGVAGVDAQGITMTVKLNLYDPETGDATEIEGATKAYTFVDEVITSDEFDFVLDDTLNFNLYIKDTRAAKVVFEYNKTPEIEANTRATKEVTTLNSDGYFEFNVELAPAQAYDLVKYTVYDAAGSVIRENETSLAEYLGVVIRKRPNNSKTVAFAEALYDYCKAAADFFGYNASAYTDDYYFSDIEYRSPVVEPSDGTGKITEVSYVATSEPALRFTMNMTEAEAAALTANSNIGTASFAKRDGDANDIVLEVKEIPVVYLNRPLSIEVDGKTISYMPIIYAYVAARSNNAALSRLGVSIANLNAAANGNVDIPW